MTPSVGDGEADVDGGDRGELQRVDRCRGEPRERQRGGGLQDTEGDAPRHRRPQPAGRGLRARGHGILLSGPVVSRLGTGGAGGAGWKPARTRRRWCAAASRSWWRRTTRRVSRWVMAELPFGELVWIRERGRSPPRPRRRRCPPG